MKDSIHQVPVATTTRSKLGLFVVGRKRPGFDQDWNQTMRAQASEALAALGYECVGGDAPVADDAAAARVIAQIRKAGCEALVVLQPSLGHGQLSLTVMQQWGKPVVLWATPERQESPKASSCSLVAQHLWASIFRQANHPFEIICGAPRDEGTRTQLERAVALSRTKVRLEKAKLGTLGGTAPGFLGMTPDLYAMKRQLGVQLAPQSLPQFIDRVRGFDETLVAKDVERVRSMKLPMRDVTADDLNLQSRYYLALRQTIEEEFLDALALQDWPELSNDVGQWPYLAMSRICDEGFPISMEGDADGAVLCLMARHLNMGLAFITDWLEHDEETITFWHAGTVPMSMCPPAGSEGGPTLARHFNVEKPMVVDGTLRVDQPITVARLWRCDDRYHMTAFEGRTVPLKRKLTGNVAVAQIDGGDVPGWFDTLCHAGFPHHPVVFYGRHGELLRRMARMLQANWIHKP
jgi:L-fucose isomerase-like protein